MATRRRYAGSVSVSENPRVGSSILPMAIFITTLKSLSYKETATDIRWPFWFKVPSSQPVDATAAESTSAGVRQSRVSRGRVFSFLATTSSWRWVTPLRSSPFGKY
jgi:hypothetical protein